MKVLAMEDRNWPLGRAEKAAGSAGDFTAWVRQTREGIYATLVRIVRNESDAEDLLQDTYLRALDRLDSYRGEGEPEAWLRRIAVRLALNHLRARKLRRFLPLSPGGEETAPREDPESPQSTSQPDKDALLAQRRERLELLLRKFPAKAQAAFALRQLEDRPYTEIGALLGCSEATARSLVSRTTARLEREVRQRGWQDD